MRVTREQAARNRQAIVEGAGRRFREHGIDGVAVADVMNEAGFTHGGFYNHFDSKEALVAAVCESEIARSNLVLAENLADETSPKAWRRHVAQYLSAAHRDDPAHGCTVAALVGDAARQPLAVKRSFAGGLEAVLRTLTTVFAGSSGDPRRRALKEYSEIIGAMILSRAVAEANPALAEEILDASRRKPAAE